MNKIYLASNSPRRKELIKQLGLEFIQLESEIDETPYFNEPADRYCLRLAIEKNKKAQAVRSEQYFANLPILTADTTVSIDQEILGKPKNTEDAIAMLKQLSGRTHYVFTALCVSYNEQHFSCVQTNEVEFKVLTHSEITAYVATGIPLDKAGAYGIQGIGGCFVKQLSGSFTGVMGLPLYETAELLRQCGIKILSS
ncbi:septum formation protein Maf [Vespertiliibacter pulmonis]|uniref:dTTP/UTP pyrophosphatase n=1 Tax=Vespertiliibacter pulmonis TaxID=1443036 RepID=A0A3N4W1T1_9PAST|nr:septum formation protein Maf [Vespertiliibacter pulmonis]RPE86309.1 septum formation protein [Vespertiliibacter pulmonis]